MANCDEVQTQLVNCTTTLDDCIVLSQQSSEQVSVLQDELEGSNTSSFVPSPIIR
jgi:hypothetical protein